MDGFNPPSWPPDNQNSTTPGAEPADYEFGRPMELDDQQHQSGTTYHFPNNFPMDLTAGEENQFQTGGTAPSNFQTDRSQFCTAPWSNHPPHLGDASDFNHGNTGMQGGSDQYRNDRFFNGYTSPTFFATPTSLRTNLRLGSGSPRRALTNQGGNSYYPNSRMAPSQPAIFNPPLNAGSNQLVFNNHGSSFYSDYRMTPSQPPAFNPPLHTGPTQHAFTDQRSLFYPNNSIARSKLAIFNPHPHRPSTSNSQLRTFTPPASPDPRTCFNVFSIIPPGHRVARIKPGQKSPSDFVQIRVQDTRSSFGSELDEIIAAQSLPENMQYATPQENMFSVDYPNTNSEPDMSNWMTDFMQTTPDEKTYFGYKHTGEQYIGRASTEYHGDDSATEYSNACALEKKAFESSQKISNAIEDEFDRQKLLRDEAVTWAQNFLPLGMKPHHEQQEKKYVSDTVYAYHPRGDKNYYYRSVVGNEVFVEHWANNKTRTGVWYHPDNDFPSRLFDEYPTDWSTNVDPNIENPQKQKELNDLRNQLCSSNNTPANHRYKPANSDPKTWPSWQHHQGEIITTTDHGTIDVPRSSITRESIMRVVSRISEPIFTGATCGGSFSLWYPIPQPSIERRQITHLSVKERRNALRRISDLLERTWNLSSMQPELQIVYHMFKDCNSSPGFGQSQYLHARFAIFDKFQKLPTELQWMIWEFCFPPKTEHLGLVVGTGNLRNEDHKIELPITLRICHESRELTKRYYTIMDKPKIQRGSRYIYKGQVTYDKRKKEYSQPRQLALGPQDAVAISDDTPENRMEITLEWYNQINEKHRKGLQSVRHLEIRDIRTSHGNFLAASRRINSNEDRSRLIPGVFTNGSLAMFKNLQTLTLTNMPPALSWRARPFRREEQEILKILISDHLDKTRVGDDRLVAKENIKIRDYTAMEGQKVKKDNGRIDFTEEFYSKMLTHLPEEYRN